SAHLRGLWAQDQPVFGLWTGLADPAVAELEATSPFDYVCVDLQHGVSTFSELPHMLQAMRAAGRAPIVRVPVNEAATIMRALDTGACAALVPMVNSADDAARAVAACRFPPEGERSWGPMWGDVRDDGALPPEEQNAASICIVMVETAAGMDDLEAIAAVPGLDGIYIGPNDLALSCGYGRETYRTSTDVDAMIQRIVDVCRDRGIVAGLHCSDIDMAAHWASRGARMLTAATDTTLLRGAISRTWAALDEAAGLPEGRGTAPFRTPNRRSY
ncbi:MAG: aldolase/citrate lyase family protein, partial [Candidatus Nanopelagicales bacterium]